jgi:hypothetical protein
VQFHPEAEHDIFAASWRDTIPAKMKNYKPLPDAPKMLSNFLYGTGVLKT